MSAGICIMNKNAIALAADSAVTIGNHLTVHNSANKLFALSKTEPVGVIIYSNAELMGVPVEIMLKQYKKAIGNRSFDTLEQYVQDFFSFLLQQSKLFHFNNNEASYVQDIYKDLLNGLNGDYQFSLQKSQSGLARPLTAQELSELQHDAVCATLKFVDNMPFLNGLDVTDYIKDKYFEEIRDYISRNFPWITADDLANLVAATCSVFDRRFFRNGYVGLAFAGYGKGDLFPQMIHIHLSGIINEKVRYFEIEKVSITETFEATIVPLAQTDVMQTFLFGINDSFIQELEHEIPLQVANSIQKVDDSFFATGKKQDVQRELNTITAGTIQRIIQKAQKQYLWPITQAVATLPIKELALLAESMINITSIRRQVAIDNNIGTVGGPIDVAIVSKCDGFIWLKHKHYFDRTYNPQYFYSHYVNQSQNLIDPHSPGRQFGQGQAPHWPAQDRQQRPGYSHSPKRPPQRSVSPRSGWAVPLGQRRTRSAL